MHVHLTRCRRNLGCFMIGGLIIDHLFLIVFPNQKVLGPFISTLSIFKGS